MPNIQVLDPHVADLIAAGEVVERPASVAKELMENAVDAGASKVTVEISHGGMAFLRVTDDGKGIPAGELKTAFLRHATSKLHTEYDLEAIGTLGFRGEALAAISAVSRVEVMTRTPDAPLGSALTLEGGVPGEVEEAGCPLGTTMVVRDLFYNTPARLKFMKKDSAEGAAVFSAVQRLALSHPEVSVKFIREGKQELLTPGDGKLKSAVYAVLGRELALGLREVKGSGEDMTVTGFVSLPACCRNSRGNQYFFVNGRQVKSPLMMAALEEAYRNQRMVGKYPACVLHLTTKLNAVDVNVHPAKTEVKFGQERQVFSAVYHAVLSALEGDRSHPALTLEGSGKGRETTLPGWKSTDTVTPNQTTITVQPGKAPSQMEERASARPAAAPSAPPAVPTAAARPGVGLEAGGAVQVSTPAVAPSAPVRSQPGKGASPLFGKSRPRSRGVDVFWDEPEEPVAPKEPVRVISQMSPAAPVAPIPEEKEPEKAAPQEKVVPSPAPAQPSVIKEAVVAPAPASPIGEEPSKEEEPLREEERPWRMAGEVLNTYIIVEQGDQVFFIDKHAAHERMNFDRMKAQGYDPMAQSLLAPVVFRLEPEEQQALLERRELLEEFGFEVDELGDSLAVRQAPFDVAVEDIPSTLAELAHKLLTTGTADPAAARDELLHTMACKAAIKGGWKTSPQELERVARAVMDGAVKYCPHGRPVAIELTKKELEKQFKRA
ncbi:DNA mismatch repair endonuclease MutL [Flavonifractor sp. An100]|uniref:DNA mismatch repair endonuclease MutL n=1 Tax=Flavonifractor sp. An100 TaxID=1965538 RepID=UPI000B3AA3C5|nr:DNA mismatch repair endonuclease MutL [Flavonifractor sp. An100]OUQ78792.1 DNA mismatch repair protein MutL [Flavonifractor sp. An100]